LRVCHDELTLVFSRPASRNIHIARLHRGQVLRTL
jgi:hypothetical protein